MKRLQDKVAIVTGGAQGMGEATVRLFVENGARVVFGDLLTEQGEALAAELGDKGVTANAVAPIPVDTPMIKAVHGPKDRAVWHAQTPNPRHQHSGYVR